MRKESIYSLVVSLALHALILSCLVWSQAGLAGMENTPDVATVTLDMLGPDLGKPRGFSPPAAKGLNVLNTKPHMAIPEKTTPAVPVSELRDAAEVVSPGEKTPEPENTVAETVVEKADSVTGSRDSADGEGGSTDPDGRSGSWGSGGAGEVEGKATDMGRKAVPLYSRNPPPLYPRTARVRRLEGMVEINVLVDTAGRVRDLNLRRSSGFSVLDRAALDSVKVWLFEPGADCSGPVSMWVVVPLVFKLTAV